MSSHGDALPAEPDEPAEARGPAADRPGASALFGLDIDLSSHEMLRRAHVLDALGPAWDPIAALRGEEAAYELLYSGLSADQQRVYDELVAAGVLPRRGGGHAAA
ncbi:DUF6400 family protein [Streptomyces sp. AK04-3B]|uniref:DUF6400 family protein n=1 Tax=Streptomyces sp. AK04-3B TaxID=3028650 RepID=UPI0029A98A57|nr:DUF6400 family protein [Streptomyces sp. AK04-3B]MDX3802649.1 DUF6400 family protein [Streptomyces sp. AK04-3B]